MDKELDNLQFLVSKLSEAIFERGKINAVVNKLEAKIVDRLKSNLEERYMGSSFGIEGIAPHPERYTIKGFYASTYSNSSQLIPSVFLVKVFIVLDAPQSKYKEKISTAIKEFEKHSYVEKDHPNRKTPLWKTLYYSIPIQKISNELQLKFS